MPAIRTRLRELGFRIHKRRVFESNVVLDTAARDLGRRGELIRIRRAGDRSIVTYKGPSKDGRHKSREEIETQDEDPGVFETILARLGLQPTFRYEKFRAEYELPDHKGLVTIDETPIGVFLELEGSPKWIDATARQLGFKRSHYITSSYGELYLRYCHDQGSKPAQMIFPSTRRGKRKIQRRIPEPRKAKSS